MSPSVRPRGRERSSTLPGSFEKARLSILKLDIEMSAVGNLRARASARTASASSTCAVASSRAGLRRTASAIARRNSAGLVELLAKRSTGSAAGLMLRGSPAGAGSPPSMLRRSSGRGVIGANDAPGDCRGMFEVGIGSKGPCWEGDVGAAMGLASEVSGRNLGEAGRGRGVAPCCGSTTSEPGGAAVTCACTAGAAIIVSPPTSPPPNKVRRTRPMRRQRAADKVILCLPWTLRSGRCSYRRENSGMSD